MWVCDGNSGAVGEDPGLIEWRECNDVLLLSDERDCEYCDCMVEVVGEVTRIFGLS